MLLAVGLAATTAATATTAPQLHFGCATTCYATGLQSNKMWSMDCENDVRAINERLGTNFHCGSEGLSRRNEWSVCDRARFIQGAQPGESTDFASDQAKLIAATGMEFKFHTFYDQQMLHLGNADCEVGSPDGNLFDGINNMFLPGVPATTTATTVTTTSTATTTAAAATTVTTTATTTATSTMTSTLTTTATPTTTTEELANSAEGSAVEGAVDDDEDGTGVAAAAGAAGAAVGVLALLAFAVTRRRRSDARDLVDDPEASIAPPPRSAPGSVKTVASEYELPVVVAAYDAFGAGAAAEGSVYEAVDVGVDYAMADASGGPTVLLSADATYDVADGAAIPPSIADATYEMADGDCDPTPTDSELLEESRAVV